MKKFILQTSKFIVLISSLIFISFLLIDNDSKYDEKYWVIKPYLNWEKKNQFEQFIKNKNPINLLLGSSQMACAVIPDSISAKWFSFSNAGQTVYDSYRFLEYYKNKVKIDTIIVSLSPFDFASSYTYGSASGIPNPYFIIYNQDSLPIFHKRKIRIANNIKSEICFSLETVYVFITNKKPDRINISSQGYENSFNPNMGNEDSLYIVEPNLFNRYIIQYFPNVMGVPNMEFFLLFHSFCKQYNIDVIYLMTPKSKYYNMLVNNSYFDEWYSIKRNLNKLKVELWIMRI